MHGETTPQYFHYQVAALLQGTAPLLQHAEQAWAQLQQAPQQVQSCLPGPNLHFAVDLPVKWCAHVGQLMRFADAAQPGNGSGGTPEAMQASLALGALQQQAAQLSAPDAAPGDATLDSSRWV